VLPLIAAAQDVKSICVPAEIDEAIIDARSHDTP
jgi:hypothetical protein